MNEPIPSDPTPQFPRWLLPCAVAACLVYLGAERFLVGGLGFPLDDSWIHLQFARNLAAGQGLSYNPGELVTGSTAPLWTALLAVLFLLPGNILAWTKLLGIAFHTAAVAATWRLARELGLGRGLAGLAGVLTLTTSWLVWSALSGMEVPLFTFLSLWGLLLHIQERQRPEKPPLSMAVLGVAALARPEGLLLLVLAVLDRALLFEREGEDGPLVWRRPPWRPILTGGGLAILALIGTLVVYRWAGGSFLPTTFGAKGGDLRRWVPNLGYVHTVIGVFFRSQPFLALLAGGGIVALLARLGTPKGRGLLPALWVVCLPLAYSLMASGPTKLMGNFGRYYFPLLPVVIVLGVLGLEPAGRALRRTPLKAVLAGAILATALWGFAQGAVRYARNVANVEDSDVKIARWLAEHVPAQAVLAVNDIGAIKFLLPNRVIDLAGIANPEIRDEVSADHGPIGNGLAASDGRGDRPPEAGLRGGLSQLAARARSRSALPADPRAGDSGQHHDGRQRDRGVRDGLDPVSPYALDCPPITSAPTCALPWRIPVPHRTSRGVDAEPGSAEKCTAKEIDERLVRLSRSAARCAGDRRSEVSPHPAAGARMEHHRLGMKAGPRQNERTLLNAARQTDRRRRHRLLLLLPAVNLNGGTSRAHPVPIR